VALAAPLEKAHKPMPEVGQIVSGPHLELNRRVRERRTRAPGCTTTTASLVGLTSKIMGESWQICRAVVKSCPRCWHTDVTDPRWSGADEVRATNPTRVGPRTRETESSAAAKLWPGGTQDVVVPEAIVEDADNDLLGLAAVLPSGTAMDACAKSHRHVSVMAPCWSPWIVKTSASVASQGRIRAS
jgi:hypothetical protein